MKIKFPLHILGKLLKILGVLMLAPALCSLIFAESDLWVFLVSAAITSVIGLVLEKTMDTGKSVEELTRKDGFIIATICWFAVGMVGALPYMLFGVFSNPVDAIFESVSGFTTTGASVLTDIESLTHGMLFWRCFTQWLGGMGIIVLGVAILPRLGVGGMQLMALEGATPTTERISPRISEVAKNLWKTYLLISIIMAIALVLFGLPIYDSIVHMFSTISTGGFSSKNASIGAYNNLGVVVVITVFMFIGGINFALLYGLLRKRFSKLIFDAELRFYFFVNVALIVVVTIELSLRSYPGFFHALRDSAFQVVSVSTGTGFSTVNYDGWPNFSKWILFVLFFLGGCAGSTTGGMKNIRVLVLIKKSYHEIYKLIYPKVVLPLRVGKKPLDNAVVTGMGSFCLIYIGLFIVASLLIMAEGVPMITAISASAASLGNVGPGFELVGPASNFASMSNATKLNLSVLMLLGRLEIFTIVVLFIPAFWRE